MRLATLQIRRAPILLVSRSAHPGFNPVRSLCSFLTVDRGETEYFQFEQISIVAIPKCPSRNFATGRSNSSNLAEVTSFPSGSIISTTVSRYCSDSTLLSGPPDGRVPVAEESPTLR
jgi:hypothetical protein